MQRQFVRFSRWVAHVTGSPFAFLIAAGLIVVWGFWAWSRGFDDFSQLIVNTATTISTGLLVFIVQATTNHETAAIKAQLAELVRAEPNARNALVSLDNLSAEDLERLRQQIAVEAKPVEPSTWPG